MIKKTNAFAALLVLASVLAWSTGLGSMSIAQAASLSNTKDTLSDSDVSVASNHVVSYTSSYAVSALATISVQFDPAGQSFNLTSLVGTDITATGMTVVAACGAGTDEVRPVITTATDLVELVVCTGDTVAAGAKTITFGNLHITNPTAGSYVIRVNSYGATSENADTRVAIIDDVVMQASVDTNFTFTVAGVNVGTAINGDAVNTSATSTATLMNFGTLAVGTPKVLGQQLTVATNARNGFVVTVEQNQNLLSANGADIDRFIDGAGTAVPAAWQAPTNTIDQENTFGHYGITSEDADLNTDEFGTALYAGNIDAPRQVFSHNGPADGTTADKGLTRVAVKAQIGSLQEAASDYNNLLTYIATPTF